MITKRSGLSHPAVCLALLAASLSAQAAIESNFDDQIYPGEPGNGWVDAWQHSGGTPEIRTDNPIDGGTPYVRLDIVGIAARNFMRQYESGSGVNISAPHDIRWKFRLAEDDFASAFAVFNDRIHFFSRSASRLGASTDSSVGWSIMAAGAEHSSGAVAGQTFWIYDNISGDATHFTLENHVDSQVALVPHHVYSFEVRVFPEDRTYTVSILDETSSASFASSAPHSFRNISAPGAAQTFLHFGGQANPTGDVRPIDLDSVSITQWPGPVIENIVPNASYMIHPAGEGIQFEVVATDPVPQENISLSVNGLDVTGQSQITGTEAHWTVSYQGLIDDEDYEIQITASNATGTATVSRIFYTETGPFALYDSEGFTSDELYPVGALQPVTHGRATWEPAPFDLGDPAYIRDDAEDGKVLDRENWGAGASKADYLHLPPLSSGTLIIEFDAKVSRADTRTIDVSLMPVSGGAMSSLLGWGVVTENFSGKLAYFDGVAWQALMDLDTAWHNYQIIHYLSGPAAGFYDVIVDGTAVAERLAWRNSIAEGTAFSRVRLHSHAEGDIPEYGRIDNLIVTAAPEDPNAFPPPAIVNVSPSDGGMIAPADGLHFEVTSILAISGSNISVLLNEVDVSNDLAIIGSSDHLIVSYDQLQAETSYAVEIIATNPAGVTTMTFSFIATEETWLVDPADGWVGPWANTSGTPEFRTEDPLDDGASYLRLNTTGGIRNFGRQYESSATVDITQPHFIRWKFRLAEAEADFASAFAVFNDRIHFFSRSASRLGGSTDSSVGWSVMAAGAAHSSGAVAGQTFWIYDNVSGDATHFTLENHVDSQVALVPHHVYSFEVLVSPEDQTYLVVIVDETSGASFTSSAPHRFRDLSATPGTHTFVHFGTQASPTSEVRPFDLGAVFISSAAPPQLSLLNPALTDGVFSFSFQTETGVNYTVLVTDDLGSTEWTPLETIVGDGTVRTVTDPNPSGALRFYRVTTQLP